MSRNSFWAGAQVVTCSRRPRGDLLQLADFFFLHQAEVAAHIEAEVSREETRDPLDIERPVGEVRAGVRSALDDPDLARSAVRVIQAPAVIDGGDVVAAAMNEEKRARFE